jgi:hypothetical protein
VGTAWLTNISIDGRTVRQSPASSPADERYTNLGRGMRLLHREERIKGLTLITFIALMAYCILEHLIKQNIDPKGTTHQLMKEFAAIVFSEGEMLDGTYFYTVGNVKERHIRLIYKLGLAVGSYAVLSEVQQE